MSPLTPLADHVATKALEGTGVTTPAPVYANLTAPLLATHALRRGEGTLSEDGALIVKTGVHTGRSVQDKFTVDEPEITDDVWWRMGNQKLAPENFEVLHGTHPGLPAGPRAVHPGPLRRRRPEIPGPRPAGQHRGLAHACSPATCSSARRLEELADFEPDWVILHAPNFQADPAIDGVRSTTAIAVSFTQRLICIAGTEYGGEIKKSIFGVMNWKLPAEGVLPMHCSANVGRSADGKPGEVALFFGLSGTGKTTLSSDPNRPLIGDDEHGWGPDGVFNFEGGCYAKVINLNREAEPEIYAATHRFGTVLENVVADAAGPPRPDRRLAHREHPVLLPDRVHPQLRPLRARAGIRRTSSC